MKKIWHRKGSRAMMDGVKKNFGFGCMRLPMVNDEVDIEEMNRMVDAFLFTIRQMF